MHGEIDINRLVLPDIEGIQSIRLGSGTFDFSLSEGQLVLERTLKLTPDEDLEVSYK